MLLPPLPPQFENLEHANCLGADPSKWKTSFNGHTSNVTLSNDGNAVSSFKTPLKVTHAEDCGTVAPALTLQMDTTVDGDLAVGGDVTWKQPGYIRVGTFEVIPIDARTHATMDLVGALIWPSKWYLL